MIATALTGGRCEMTIGTSGGTLLALCPVVRAMR